jgi:hypothetical protein
LFFTLSFAAPTSFASPIVAETFAAPTIATGSIYGAAPTTFAAPTYGNIGTSYGLPGVL